jgi:hypothetical protein
MLRCAALLTGISPRFSGPAAVILLTSCSLSAQSTPTLDQLLDRMGAYLIEYESQLSSVVADERFEQNVYGLGARSRTAAATLESEVAFIRLPGGAEWLGFRDVKRVNFKAVKQGGPSVSDVLTSAAGDMTKARAIANASARHNLGLPRTINVPTAPLDIIHPAHRGAHRYELSGQESIRGTRTTVVAFTEVTRPTLVREPNGEYLVSSGRIWIEPESGVVWRVEWIYQAEKRHPRAPAPPRLRVDFERQPELGFMVPRLMTEVFSATPRARGEGRATYRNFRRFGTSARIVPQ